MIVHLFFKRAAKTMTVKRLAEVAGYYPQELYNWRSGYLPVRLVHMDALLEAAGLDIKLVKEQDNGTGESTE